MALYWAFPHLTLRRQTERDLGTRFGLRVVRVRLHVTKMNKFDNESSILFTKTAVILRMTVVRTIKVSFSLYLYFFAFVPFIVCCFFMLLFLLYILCKFYNCKKQYRCKCIVVGHPPQLKLLFIYMCCKGPSVLRRTSSPCSQSAPPCKNGGECRDTATGYHCQCLEGYSGSRCESKPAFKILFWLVRLLRGCSSGKKKCTRASFNKIRTN